MSAFAAILRRRNGRVRACEVGRLLDDGESPRGERSTPAGWNLVERGRACLAVQHAPTTIEDQEEKQPVHDPASETDLVFWGRLDNRDELLKSLGAGAACGSGTSDARLALAAYLAWDARCFERFVGPFAILVFDARRQRFVCSRDPLGDRTLYYHRGAEEVVVASEVSALLRHPAVSDTFDEVALAHFFAVEAAPPGVSFYADVRELPPGHRLTFEADRERLERFWPSGDLGRIRYRRDAEYVEHFRCLLEESVRCRLRASGPPAVLMSGGMDSTSVAALSARELSESSPGTRLFTVSWVFDEFERADERRFIHPMIERFDLAAHFIVGDEEWPLRDPATWPVPLDAPWQGLFCRLQNAAYKAAREAGARVMLTGELGDHLYYVDEDYWLRDLIVARRGAVWRELRAELAQHGLASALRGGPTRSALARALGWRGRPVAPPVWLTPSARRLLESAPRWTTPIRARDRARPYPPVLDPRCATAAGLERSKARRADIEVRRPFRDRRLIELLLSCPAHVLYRPGSTKWILREAMRDVLPETVRCRRHVSTLFPLAARGLVDKEVDLVLGILRQDDALWRRYVSSDWLSANFPSRLRRGRDGVESVIAWQCVCSQLWSDGVRRAGLSP